MNVAYEDYERPSTPSFSGNYLSNYQPKPTSPYLFGAGEPVESAVPINSSTIEFLPPKEKPNKTLCTAHRLLVVLLLLFIILSVVMIALYITKSSISDKNITNSSISDKNSGTTNEVNCAKGRGEEDGMRAMSVMFMHLPCPWMYHHRQSELQV